MRVELDPQQEERILLPVLAESLPNAGDRVGETFERSADRGRRRLTAAGVLELKGALSRAAALEEAQRSGATTALVERREALIEALGEAEEAARGNERLIELFEAIRQAVGVRKRCRSRTGQLRTQ